MKEMSLKSVARNIIASARYGSGNMLSGLTGKVIILMYHRVVTEKELKASFIQPGMYVQKNIFDMQMKFLKDNFHILSFAELLEMWRENRWDNTKKYCVITFDDGWIDNYLNAYPVLKSYAIPATIFLPTAMIGTDKWFWPERLAYLLHKAGEMRLDLQQIAWKYSVMEHIKKSCGNREIDMLIEKCKTIPEEQIEELIADICQITEVEVPKERILMNWDEVAEMSDSGISFGSHSCTHKILTKCLPVMAQQEIENSMADLKERNISHLSVLCYPNGDCTKEIAEQVKAAGYEAAVSTSSGVEGLKPGDLFRLKRRGVHNDISSTKALFAYRIMRGLSQS